jgi:hypothetical protein
VKSALSLVKMKTIMPVHNFRLRKLKTTVLFTMELRYKVKNKPQAESRLTGYSNKRYNPFISISTFLRLDANGEDIP